MPLHGTGFQARVGCHIAADPYCRLNDMHGEAGTTRLGDNSFLGTGSAGTCSWVHWYLGVIPGSPDGRPDPWEGDVDGGRKSEAKPNLVRARLR